jgi:hypothetical protein
VRHVPLVHPLIHFPLRILHALVDWVSEAELLSKLDVVIALLGIIPSPPCFQKLSNLLSNPMNYLLASFSPFDACSHLQLNRSRRSIGILLWFAISTNTISDTKTVPTCCPARSHQVGFHAQHTIPSCLIRRHQPRSARKLHPRFSPAMLSVARQAHPRRSVPRCQRVEFQPPFRLP